MIKSVLTILLCISFNGFLKAQNPNDTIKLSQFNATFLEQLIAQNINGLRKSENLDSLANDTILKKAADDQAKYVLTKGIITHKQENTQKATSRVRVVYYGGNSMRGIGENIAGVTILSLVKVLTPSGADSILHIQTYQQAADVLMGMWVGSPHHYKNVMYEAFKYNGLAVSLDPKTRMLYAVQVFGYE